MNILNEEQLNKTDSFLTKLKEILRKHWGIILILSIVGLGYWVMTLPDVEEPYIVKEYEEIDKNGEVIIIEVWSDGVETVADEE